MRILFTLLLVFLLSPLCHSHLVNSFRLADNHACGANGAPIEKVQQLAGHLDIRTTQLFYKPSAKYAEDAARYIQIQ